MNQTVANKLRKGIAIALKNFPYLKDCDGKSGIYFWNRIDENGEYCWYIGKAKNLLIRTAQHIVGSESHLDKSIKKHGLCGVNDNGEHPFGWCLVVEFVDEDMLDQQERGLIEKWRKTVGGKMYNVESGGTTGKTIIGERKQRRDVKWKAEAKNKVLAKYREYFDLQPKENAYKNGGTELKAEPKQLKTEYYG